MKEGFYTRIDVELDGGGVLDDLVRLLGKIFGRISAWSKLRRSCVTSRHFHKYLQCFLMIILDWEEAESYPSTVIHDVFNEYCPGILEIQ